MSAEFLSDVCPDEREISTALPVDMLPADDSHWSAFELVELLLKDPQKADALNREEKRQALLIPRWLAISLASYLLFSIAMMVILNTAPAEAYPQRLLPVPA